MTPVAIIFDNFGPYHVSRLRAASAACDLLAIEVAASERRTYAWDKVSSPGRKFQASHADRAKEHE